MIVIQTGAVRPPTTTLDLMSEPQQPPVPPSAQPSSASPPAPPAPHLPAAPQYPGSPQNFPPTPQNFPPSPQQQHPQQQSPQAAPPQYQTPQYQTQPYGQPNRPASGPGNPLARTAFIIALAVAAVDALRLVLQPFVLTSFGYAAGGFGVYSFFFTVIVFLGSAAAVVLGVIALRRPGGHVFAGIAIGVGGVQLIGIVLSWISSLFYNFL